MLDILDSVCHRMEEGHDVDLSHLDRILEFLKGYFYARHHAKEEECLYPALEEAGLSGEEAPVRGILMEHGEGRGRVRGMRDALASLHAGDAAAARDFIENARAYGDLLRSHIRKEDEILFPMAERCLSIDKREELTALFEKVEEERVGPGRSEEYDATLEELRRLYLEGGLERRAG